ncbi:hypothetical protein L2D25_14765 [Salmonella enterica subsp. enterica serovar Muenchen]|uniref:hypothetical protein n=1 Tax=Salmonella enterica TaxID=28901 RepID=UPI001F0E8B64|nr:hypothetical protein [Salmonella enterica]EEJ6214842.1 hypothetical protein [Salmonella enterica]MCH5442714.1 hypothetical protein [Salmonella enterica subsp. enterica serovar Muenchen]
MLIEIYSRLNSFDDLTKLMLQPPNIYREETIKAYIVSLVAYVDHVNAVIWWQQERGRLCDFDIRHIMPALFEIHRQVRQTFIRNDSPLSEIAGCIPGLISLVSFYLSRIEGNNDKNRVLH